MVIIAEHRSKLAAIHRQWWRLQMREKFSSGTKNYKQTTLGVNLLSLMTLSWCLWISGTENVWFMCNFSVFIGQKCCVYTTVCTADSRVQVIRITSSSSVARWEQLHLPSRRTPVAPLDLWWPGLLLHLTGEASPAYADLAGQRRPAWTSPVF